MENCTSISALLRQFPIPDATNYFRAAFEQSSNTLNDKHVQDLLLAKAFYDLALAAENQQKSSSIPMFYNPCLNLAIFRSMPNTQATIINCLIRSYLLTKNLMLAAKFVENVKFPESASNNDFARFHYYQGRIKALELDYESATSFFYKSLQKAPQAGAVGFRQNIQKWIVIVQLLQGKIPKRSIFREEIHRKTLAPYLQLAQTVRLGNLMQFDKLLEELATTFKNDETQTLVVRLRPNVIKTAIRLIAMTYSRIYLSEIAKKLQLPSELEAVYVVAKAIKDRTVANATIVYDANGAPYLETSDPRNIYQTNLPQAVLDKRIVDCLELHNTAVRALRYDNKDDGEKAEPLSVDAMQEREMMEMEYASEMADEEDDF